MQKVILIFVFLLSSCSDLSTTEDKVLGHWDWSLKDGVNESSGYFNFRKDRTYSYNITSKSRTELLVEGHEHYLPHWRIKGNKVCFAASWEGGSIFESLKITKEYCWLQFGVEDGKTYLSIDDGHNKIFKKG